MPSAMHWPTSRFHRIEGLAEFHEALGLLFWLVSPIVRA
jgi:hypothetical protein